MALADGGEASVPEFSCAPEFKPPPPCPESLDSIQAQPPLGTNPLRSKMEASIRTSYLSVPRCDIAGWVPTATRLRRLNPGGSKMLTRARLAVAVAAAVLVANAALHAQEASLTSEVSRLVALLELRSNSVVGDLGAGSGEVSIEIARQLGPTSRVYGTDINAQRIAEIKEAATKAGLKNVVVLEGAPASTNLPEACCD